MESNTYFLETALKTSVRPEIPLMKKKYINGLLSVSCSLNVCHCD